MDIKHEQKDRRGSFVIKEGDETLALMAYRRIGSDQINIYHTEVDEKLRGKGIGEELVAAAVEFARENDLKIVATCPYARKVIEGNDSYKDILAAQ